MGERTGAAGDRLLRRWAAVPFWIGAIGAAIVVLDRHAAVRPRLLFLFSALVFTLRPLDVRWPPAPRDRMHAARRIFLRSAVVAGIFSLGAAAFAFSAALDPIGSLQGICLDAPMASDVSLCYRPEPRSPTRAAALPMRLAAITAVTSAAAALAVAGARGSVLGSRRAKPSRAS